MGDCLGHNGHDYQYRHRAHPFVAPSSHPKPPTPANFQTATPGSPLPARAQFPGKLWFVIGLERCAWPKVQKFVENFSGSNPQSTFSRAPAQNPSPAPAKSKSAMSTSRMLNPSPAISQPPLRCQKYPGNHRTTDKPSPKTFHIPESPGDPPASPPPNAHPNRTTAQTIPPSS